MNLNPLESVPIHNGQPIWPENQLLGPTTSEQRSTEEAPSLALLAGRCMSQMKRIESLYRSESGRAYVAQQGARLNEVWTESLSQAADQDVQLADSLRGSIYRDYYNSPFLAEAMKMVVGAEAEHAAYRLVHDLGVRNREANNSYTYHFDYRRASLEEDLAGIDGYIMPDPRLSVFQTEAGQAMRLAISIKNVPHLPEEVNDIIYPLQDRDDVDRIYFSLGSSLESFKLDSRVSASSLRTASTKLHQSVEAAYQRYQDLERLGQGRSLVEPIIPAIMLMSLNGRELGQDFVSETELDTLEFQLVDNQDKWI